IFLHHTDDRIVAPIQLNGFAEDVRIGAVIRTPDGIANDYDRVVPGTVVAGINGAAELRPSLQGLEKVSAHERASDAQHAVTGNYVEHALIEHRDGGKGVAQPLPVENIR